MGTPTRNGAEVFKLAGMIGYTFPQYQAQPLDSLIKNASPLAIDLLKSMLSFDASKRPSASKAL